MAKEILIYLRIESGQAVPVDSDKKVIAAEKRLPGAVYTENPIVKIRPLKEDNTPYTLAELTYDIYEFGIDSDKNLSTDPLVYHYSGTTAFTLSEVTVGTKTYAQIAFQIDTYKAGVEDLFESDTKDKTLYAEFNTFTAGEERPQLTWQFSFIMKAKVLPLGGGSPPAGSVELYRTAAAQDAIDLGKQDKDSEQEISVDTALTAYAGRKTIFASGTTEITLHTAADSTAELLIINVGTAIITITPYGTETINGATGSITISSQYKAYRLKAYDGNWICPDLLAP